MLGHAVSIVPKRSTGIDRPGSRIYKRYNPCAYKMLT